MQSQNTQVVKNYTNKTINSCISKSAHIQYNESSIQFNRYNIEKQINENLTWRFESLLLCGKTKTPKQKHIFSSNEANQKKSTTASTFQTKTNECRFYVANENLLIFFSCLDKRSRIFSYVYTLNQIKHQESNFR